MPRAVNPETGEVLFLVDDQWVPPTQTAKNEAGEAAYLINNQWVLPGQDYVGAPAGTSNPFMGIVGRAAEIVGSGVEAVARVGEKAGDALETALPISNLSPDEIKNKRQLEPMFQFADKLKNVSKDIGYSPTTKLSDIGDNPLTVIPFVAERIISSSPDMAAAVLASPAYITSLTNEILNDRLANDKKTLADATVKDVSLSLAAAFAQGKFEKFATNRLIKGGTTGATTTGRIAKETGIQFGTEGVEEGIDYLGRTVDTKKGVDPKELLASMAEGAITGGGLGATVQGARELLGRNKAREIDAEKNVIDTLAQEEAKTAPEAVPLSETQAYDQMMREAETGIAMQPLQQAPIVPVEPAIQPIPTAVAPMPTVEPLQATPAATFVPNAPPSDQPVITPTPEIDERALQQNNFAFVGKDGQIKSVYGSIGKNAQGRDVIKYKNAQGKDNERLLTPDVVVNPTPDDAELLSLYKERNKLDKEKDNFKEWLFKKKINPRDVSDLGMEMRGFPISYLDKNAVGLDVLALDALDAQLLTEADLEGYANQEEAMRDIIRSTLEGTGEAPTLFNTRRAEAKNAVEGQIEAIESAKKGAPEEAVAPEFVPPEPAIPAEAVTPREYVYREPVTPSTNVTEEGELMFSKNTVEQNKAADSVLKKHQTKFKGASIAYRNGDLTLIKTMNPRNGAVIYTPAKGTSYPTIPYEITSDEGRRQLTAMGLSTAEKRELVLERQRLEAEAQAKHEKNPYLKLKDGVNASAAVPKNMLGVVNSWAKLLNLQGKIYITTVDDAAANKDKYTGPHRTIGNLGIRAGTGVTIKLEDGTSVIVFKKGSSITQNLEIIAHEMGHIHEKQVFNNAPPETQAAIKKAYAEWKSGITAKTPAREMVDKLRAKQTAQTTKIPEGVLVGDVKDISYWTGFNEWYADQVARWSVSSEKPVTVVDKFFAKLAAALRKFYNTVKGQKYLPNETFKQYLDAIASKAQFDSLIEEKAPKGQMALFSQGEVETKTNTPAFKRWFGDSKVVDENGQPKVVYHGTDKNDFDIFDPASWFTENTTEASAYAQTDILRKRERLLGKYKLSDDTSVVGKRIPFASVLSDIGDLEVGKYYAEGGADGPVYKYLGKNKFEILKNVVVDLDSQSLRDMTTALKIGKSQEAIDRFNETQEYAKEFVGGEGGRVYPVYLSIKNPLYLDAMQANTLSQRLGKSKEDIQKQIDEWKSQGYDGIVTTSDEARFFPEVREAFGGEPKQYIPFDANQIKSAIGNTGAYDVNADEMQFSRSELEAEGPTGIQKLNKIRRNYRGEIVSPEQVWSIPDDSKFERFIYKIQDKFIDTKRVVQAIKTQIKDITDKWDAYLKEELYHGRTAKRTKDFLQNELLPIVQKMRNNNISVIEFDTFLHARHAKERNEQIAKINPEFLKDGSPNPNWMPDGGSGMFTKDAEAYMAKLDPKKKKTLEELANKVDGIVKDTQNILVKSGLESQDTIDTWNKTYQHYVPLMRKDLDFAQEFTGLGSGFQVKGGASKRAFGSFKEVADIFANIANQRERAIVRSEKARVGNALYGLAIMNPNTNFWLPVNPDAIKDPEKLVAELEAMGIDPKESRNLIQEPQVADTDPQTGTVVYKVNPILRNSPNVFSVRIGGQQRYIFFNPNNERAMRMVQAVKNLDAEELGWALGNAAKVTRWIASVNTQYNPVFGAYNFIRDTLGAQFNLTTTPIAGQQAKVTAGVLPALRGIYKDLRSQRAGEGAAKGEWAQLWEEYQQEGGATGYRDQFSKNREEQSVIEREVANLEKGNVKKGVAAVFNWLSDYNDAMENAVRLSAYKVALDKGLSKERAASLAKNLTVNFNRKGERAQQLGALYAFFNASVQGSARLAETLKGPAGKKIIGGGLLLGSVQALSLAMMGFKDDEPSEFVKERNLVIPFPDGRYIAIPMPLGLHVIPNIGRITTELVLNGGKDAGKKVANLTGVLMDSFNPIGNAGLSMQSLSPTMLDPVAAIIENKDTFGRPIAREDRATNPTPGYTRTRETASYLGKELSYFLNIASGGTKYQKGLISPTPDQIDFLAGQATGGVGREISKLEQTVAATVTGEELPSYKVPLVGKFYGDVTSQAAQANRFYENITKMANYENEIKGRQKDRVSIADFMQDHPEARLYQRANQLENEISKLNREKRDLVEKGADKSRIKAIEERKTRIMTQFNNQVESLEK